MNISPIVAARNTARPFGALSFWQSLYIPNETNGPAIAIENVFAPSVVSPPCARRSAWNKSTIIPSKDIIDGPKRIAPSPVPVGCEQLPVTEGILSDERMKTKAPASARSIFVLLFFFACFCILIPPAIRNGIHTTPHIIQ